MSPLLKKVNKLARVWKCFCFSVMQFGPTHKKHHYNMTVAEMEKPQVRKRGRERMRPIWICVCMWVQVLFHFWTNHPWLIGCKSDKHPWQNSVISLERQQTLNSAWQSEQWAIVIMTAECSFCHPTHTHFNLYNIISIISILIPLLRSRSFSHESSFPFTTFFTHKLLNPLYCSISFDFLIIITSIFVPFADEPLWLFLVIFEFLKEQFLHRPFHLIFSLPLTHLFCHTLTNSTLSLFSFKTCSSTGFVSAMSWCGRSCWLLVMFSQNIHSVSLSYVQSYWILGQQKPQQ